MPRISTRFDSGFHGAFSSMYELPRRTRLQTVAGKLHTLSPVATLARGYAVPRSTDGVTLASVEAFTDDMPFDLVVRDGVVPSRVDRSRENGT